MANTLVAENPELKASILAFEKQKAEQNAESLASLLGEDWNEQVEQLARIGFLEKVGTSWKVPMLYRSGLQITQGAAFVKTGAQPGGEEDDDDDEGLEASEEQ